MKKKNHYNTIVISDVHLGTKSSKAKELLEFLKSSSCNTLILNGDIIDGWRLQKSGKWEKQHTSLLKYLIKLIDKKQTNIIYLRGNHDDFLEKILPFQFISLSILREYYHISNEKKYLVIHGDIFDHITSNVRWLAKLGDLGYTILLMINKVYNNRRLKRGKSYYSISKVIKHKVKRAVSYISGFEEKLIKLARSKGCDGVICGHIHHPAIIDKDNITYMNSGDWVESLSALVETEEGDWKIVYYNDLFL
ncbi:MAG: UDP-2,3-diacylglucosamine diphosphatase [Bacteroidales bacterium]|nr:UDP-2,3-diacylglucosamine diphosphatase [Bacteroidales bacterium]